jgi:N-acetylneuraminic acid mutarotase
MLSNSIKSKIEQKFGQKIRYSKDCENLALHISSYVGANISSSTVKRLFGFVKTTSKPNKYTLDIIACYLNMSNWEELMNESTIQTVEFNRNQTSKKKYNSIIYLSIICITICILSIAYNIHLKPDNSSKWSELNHLPEVRNGGNTIRSANKIYYIGGTDAEFVRNNNWVLDLNLKKWQILKEMPTKRSEMGCVYYKNNIYCFGGWLGNKKGATNLAEVYSVKHNKWDTLPRLPKTLISVEAEVYKDKIYIIGGTIGETRNYFFEYNIKTNQYHLLNTFQTKRIHYCVQKTGEKLYIFGGNSFHKGEYTICKNVDEYDFKSHKWTKKSPLPEALMCSDCVTIGSEIHLFGGKNMIGDIKKGLKNSHYIFNVQKNKWSKGAVLPFKICNHQLIHFKNQLILFGGSIDFPNPSKKVWLYFYKKQLLF